jgi:two-component system phosphate regulon response regulator PhoB/two-component system alkaline phosphatase synthesis response regulator PhoP
VPQTIAVIDDEKDILSALKIGLEKEGYLFKGFSAPEKLFSFLLNNKVDLLILDIMLPDASGLDILKTLRKDCRFENIPIILLSARSAEFDKVLGLELGADDYIAKPFSLRELAARAKAALRRNTPHIAENSVPKIDDKNKNEGAVLKIDRESFEVYAENKKVELTMSEFKLLELLSSKENKVFTRDEILNYLWGAEKDVTDRTIDFHIKNLRKKLGRLGNRIKNVRSIGYKYEN